MRYFMILLLILTVAGSVSADEMAVTVYGNNLGVVSEKRTLEFQKGTGRIAFKDVPSQIDANSVRFEVISDARVNILEQNFAFDLVSPARMYNRYIDEEIELFDTDGKLYTGTLLAYNKGEVTLQDNSGRIKIVMLSKISEVNFPSLPDGLITRPTLFWLYNSNREGSIDCNVSYQTTGMSWTAEYVGLLNSEEDHLDLSGWAAINNVSGKTYEDALLKLVAGDIHRAPPAAPRLKRMTMAAEVSFDGGFQEKEFFEYHLYTLPRRATLADREIKQISLFEATKTRVEKVYQYKPDQNPTKVEVAIKFINSDESGLGIPLPAGRVRLFKADDDGSLILLGEDRIDHTPKDEEVSVKVGFAFDISAEHRLANQVRISQKIEERDFEIELRNHKSESVEIEVAKKLYGFWEILESNFEYRKKDAYTVIFIVPVEADQEVVLKIKVRYNQR